MQNGKSRSIEWETAKEYMKENVPERDQPCCSGKTFVTFKVTKTCVMGVKPIASWICNAYKPIS